MCFLCEFAWALKSLLILFCVKKSTNREKARKVSGNSVINFFFPAFLRKKAKSILCSTQRVDDVLYSSFTRKNKEFPIFGVISMILHNAGKRFFPEIRMHPLIRDFFFFFKKNERAVWRKKYVTKMFVLFFFQ